ncbi:5050_t:CDS:1, partial [Gigaspora margarita]
NSVADSSQILSASTNSTRSKLFKIYQNMTKNLKDVPRVQLPNSVDIENGPSLKCKKTEELCEHLPEWKMPKLLLIINLKQMKLAQLKISNHEKIKKFLLAIKERVKDGQYKMLKPLRIWTKKCIILMKNKYAIEKSVLYNLYTNYN